jgi:hypothetical protein
MKKEIRSKNKNITMATKSVPKRIQSILSALTEFVVDIVGDVGDDNIIRKAMADNQDQLVSLLKANMPVQKITSLKKVKDPNAPKRGKSSYIYFCVETREDIKESNPDMSAKDIIKELGRVWREDVTDKEKSRYTKMSAIDKVRYQREMKDYTPPPGAGKVSQKKAGPKRGLTAYIFFCKNHRAVLKEEQPDLPTKEVTKELGKCWRELSEKDRKPFDKLAAKDKLRFENEKASWVNPDDNQKAKAPAKAKKAPAKARRKSGYILYCQEARPTVVKDNYDLSSQEVTKELGRTWKKLSDEEQGKYNERAANAHVGSKTSKKKKKKKVKVEPDPGSDIEELLDESE